MSDIRLYVDEDAEKRVIVNGLRDRGVDVVMAFDVDKIGATDREQLDYAIENERVLYSLNVSDFAQLHHESLSTQRTHFGIALIPKQGYGVGEKLRCVIQFVEVKSAEEMRNQIEYL